MRWIFGAEKFEDKEVEVVEAGGDATLWLSSTFRYDASTTRLDVTLMDLGAKLRRLSPCSSLSSPCF